MHRRLSIRKNMETTHSTVQEYYGKVLGSSKDLKTSACCSPDSMPAYLRPILSELHTEVVEKFYGCGSPIPLALEGRTVLDLGSGTGRDSFIISKLVGEKGSVVGIDMTDEQLTVANRHIGFHQEKFGYKKPNIKFYKSNYLLFLFDSSFWQSLHINSSFPLTFT